MAGKDPMAFGLSVLNKVAASETLDKLGLRKFTERAIHQSTKSGFQAAGSMQRTFKKVAGGGKGKRPSSNKPSGVFDLTPTEDQQMMVEVISEFASAVLRPGAEVAEKIDDTPKEVLNSADSPRSDPRLPASSWPRLWPKAIWARQLLA